MVEMVVWFGLGPLLFWLHGLVFFLLVVPLGVLVIGKWRSLDRRGWLILLLWPPLVMLLNLPWLLPMARFLWAQTGTAAYLQGGLPALAADLLGIGFVEGASWPAQLGVRWLVLALGGLGLWRLARHSSGREGAGRAIGITVVVAFVAAYGLSHLPGGGNLQPYRYIEQAALWSTIGLADGLAVLRGWFSSRQGGGRWRPVLGLVLAAAGLYWLATTGWQFRPVLLGGENQNRWQGPTAEVKALCEHLKTLPGRGRILLDDFRLAALLPWCSGREVIGGPFAHVFTDYGYANANTTEFLGVPYRDYPARAWQEEISAYQIGWVVAYRDWGRPDWYTLTDWLADHPSKATAGPVFGPYQLYNLNQGIDPLVVEADYNRLRVEADPEQAERGYTLPYHWIPGLRAEPAGVQLRPRYFDGDPAPFIHIEPGGVANFTIYHYTGYR